MAEDAAYGLDVLGYRIDVRRVAGERTGPRGIQAAEQLCPSLRGSVQCQALGKTIGIQSAVEVALAGSSVQPHEHRKVLNVARYV